MAKKKNQSPPLVESYKVPVDAEQAKLGITNERYYQLSFLDAEPKPDRKDIGLMLTVPQERALSAVQILLAETNYQGNLEPIYTENPTFGFKGNLPRLSITPTRFLEAYGIEGNNKNSGKKAQDAFRALYSLTENFDFVIRGTQGKSRISLVVTTNLLRIHKDNSEQGNSDEPINIESITIEKSDSAKSADVISRAQRIIIEFSPPLINGLDNFFILKDSQQIKKLEDALKDMRNSNRARLSAHHVRFINWLQTNDKDKTSIGLYVLAHKLGLDYLLADGQEKRVRKHINESIELAKATGYLLGSEVKDIGAGWRFTLNPEKCSRIGIGKNKRLDSGK